MRMQPRPLVARALTNHRLHHQWCHWPLRHSALQRLSRHPARWPLPFCSRTGQPIKLRLCYMTSSPASVWPAHRAFGTPGHSARPAIITHCSCCSTVVMPRSGPQTSHLRCSVPCYTGVCTTAATVSERSARCSRFFLRAGGRPDDLAGLVGDQLARCHDLVEQRLGDVGEERQRPQDLQRVEVSGLVLGLGLGLERGLGLRLRLGLGLGQRVAITQPQDLQTQVVLSPTPACACGGVQRCMDAKLPKPESSMDQGTWV